MCEQMSYLEAPRLGMAGERGPWSRLIARTTYIGEPLEAVGRVLHSGRPAGVVERRVAGEDSRPVATATASFIVASPLGASGSET
jgi:hypothetical protein